MPNEMYMPIHVDTVETHRHIDVLCLSLVPGDLGQVPWQAHTTWNSAFFGFFVTNAMNALNSITHKAEHEIEILTIAVVSPLQVLAERREICFFRTWYRVHLLPRKMRAYIGM